jgi:hypothetical protein
VALVHDIAVILTRENRAAATTTFLAAHLADLERYRLFRNFFRIIIDESGSASALKGVSKTGSMSAAEEKKYKAQLEAQLVVLQVPFLFNEIRQW